jgi:plasmid maintenance system antidote protein VapI
MTLDQYMKKFGVTGTEVGAAIGRTHASVSRYLSGEQDIPLSILVAIRKYTEGRVKLNDWDEAD